MKVIVVKDTDVPNLTIDMAYETKLKDLLDKINQGQIADKIFKLYNQHGKELAHNIPIRGNMYVYLQPTGK